jgi:hypothetical protein
MRQKSGSEKQPAEEAITDVATMRSTQRTEIATPSGYQTKNGLTASRTSFLGIGLSNAPSEPDLPTTKRTELAWRASTE